MQGKREDEAGNYSAAIILFSEGIDGLRAMSDAAMREDNRLRYESIVDEYAARVQELHTLLLRGAQPTVVPSGLSVEPSTPSASAATEPSTDGMASALAQGRLCAELALQADEAGDRDDETVRLYTTAAEHYMGALKLDSDESARAQHRAMLTMCIERAEVIKKLPHAPAPTSQAPSASSTPDPAPAATPSAPARPVPLAGQALGADEKEVLARSSKIAGLLFNPWLADGQRETFHYPSAWEDPDGLLPLSEQQQRHFGGWARPSQFVRELPAWCVSSMHSLRLSLCRIS